MRQIQKRTESNCHNRIDYGYSNQGGEGIVSAGKELAKRLYKNRQLIKKIGSKEGDIYTGEIGTKIKNLIPSRDEIEDPIAWAARTSLPPI